ncbi:MULTISPECIES: hypothetical protein [unclassified Actinomyces]|uniref:hypothetical protein n=1 Tax=unclassified Actinomyces TaxID=2609248 RepID=UPI0020173004|nr:MULTISPECIES: hypothetical protein [unclassified Actinomyces]MCL3777879.1 hypothetical protein [Actinomyces sp. AC-20-1]MCL3789240.1 hypothetical protein [Actinomyces sp. 187325]MCL3791593.1 hypothetical protein [Actinomyces sp. 186855]MCL3793535.1 hypothetical protein [Actinomyces sp. 217892]
MSHAPLSPGPAGHGYALTRSRPNADRTTATVIGWVSVLLVPVAGVVAMAADQQTGWGLFFYILALAPCQAVAHVVVATMFHIARSKAPDRPVAPWIPLAYSVYLLAFLTASFLLLDTGSTPEHYSPWRESAGALVTPLIIVSLIAFLAMAVLVVIDLVRSVKAQAAAHYPPPVATSR